MEPWLVDRKKSVKSEKNKTKHNKTPNISWYTGGTRAHVLSLFHAYHSFSSWPSATHAAGGKNLKKREKKVPNSWIPFFQFGKLEKFLTLHERVSLLKLVMCDAQVRESLPLIFQVSDITWQLSKQNGSLINSTFPYFLYNTSRISFDNFSTSTSMTIRNRPLG